MKASLILVAATVSTGPALASSIPVIIIFWTGLGVWSPVRGGFRRGVRAIAPILFMHNLFSSATWHSLLSLLSLPLYG
jgi:hypothetical protein